MKVKNDILRYLLYAVIFFFICLTPRLFYPLTSNWDLIDINIIKDDNNKTYLYQADPYYFYYNSMTNPDNDLLSKLGYYLFDYYEYIPILFIWLTTCNIFIIIRILTQNEKLSFIFATLYSFYPFVLISSYKGLTDTNTLIFYFTTTLIFIVLHFLYLKGWHKSYAIFLFLLSSWLFSVTWPGWYLVHLILFISFIFYVTRHPRYYFISVPIVITIIYYVIERNIFIFGFNDKVSELVPGYTDILTLSAGILFLIFLTIEFYKNKTFSYYMLYFFYLITFTLTTISIRFRSLFYISFFILLPYMITKIDNQKIKKSLTYGIMSLILIWSFFFILTSDFQPMMDDTIIDSCTYINTNIPKNKTIIGIWDYGHLYQAYCNNKVMYPGTYQADELYYKAITSNEYEAFNILNNISPNYVLILNSKTLNKNLGEYTITKESFIYEGLLKPESLLLYHQLQCYSNERQRLCILLPKTSYKV